MKTGVKYYVDKIKWGTENELPMMPGEAIKAVIKEHHMQAIAWGYYMDIIGVETKKQQILWKDIGTELQFLGVYNKDERTYGLPKAVPKQEHEMFETYEELRKEIKARSYDNIKGLKSKVTKAEYMYFLSVLPPLNMKDESFCMSEFLTGELTYKFTEKGNKHFCEVVDFREENKDMPEEEYNQMRG